MSWLKALKPGRGTIVLFVAMVATWIPIYTEVFDGLDDSVEEALIVALLLIYLGLIGVYGALVARSQPARSYLPRLLTLVFFRAMLLAGTAVALVAVFLDD